MFQVWFKRCKREVHERMRILVSQDGLYCSPPSSSQSVENYNIYYSGDNRIKTAMKNLCAVSVDEGV